MQIEEGKTYKASDGSKVGPMIEWGNRFIAVQGDERIWDESGVGLNKARDVNLVSEWPEPTSPVRTVTETRTEFVGGTYGIVRVGTSFNTLTKFTRPIISVDISESYTADELDAAAKVFTDLAAALREMGK